MTHSHEGADCRLVTSPDELWRALDHASSVGRVGLDTEFMRERTYRARLCLVQLAVDDAIYIVDPLDGLDLSPIAGTLANPGIEKIVHAGKQDLELFHERFGCVPANVFDVQLGAGFAGYGASLPYGRLVQEVIGASPQKGEAYTDWCRRPLTKAQMRYAADDVRFLVGAADRLVARLSELGRLEWVKEEMEALEDPGSYGVDLDEVWKKVAGRGALSGRQTAVLRELARWREEEAATRDLPRGWVVKDPTLIEIARRTPPTMEALKGVRGLAPREADRSAGRILQAIERGKKAQPVESGPVPPKAVLARARMLSGLADAVVRARSERAGIATELVATRGELETLLSQIIVNNVNESAHRLMRGWRRDLAGDAIVALVEGRIGVRVIDEPPYIEEVEISGE